MELEQRCGSCKRVQPVTNYSQSYRGKVGTWCRQCFADYAAGRRMERGQHEPQECIACGSCYVPRQLKVKAAFCSRACKERHRSMVDAAERLASKPAERFCVHCGVGFPPTKRADAKFCSAECNMAAHRLQRTLRRRTGSGLTGYIRAEVFNRDCWKCGICRKKVNSELRYPDPQAPSLDHIVPVADGGTNEPENLRLTHLRCNCSRGRRGGNEQLAIT